MKAPPLPSRLLVILLHGIGGTGATLLPLATAWRQELPHAHFLAPDAPFPHPRGTGHQWFGVNGREFQPDRIKIVRDRFDALIAELLDRQGFDGAADRFAFVGVSQGSIMALDAVASGRWQPGAVVSFAGLLPPVAISQASVDTPILLVHGKEDRTIPSAASVVAERQLQAAGFSTQLNILPGVGHTISMDGAALALRFLRQTSV
ncbi:dienelactone hydrolase family protein [Rhizobium sp. 0TCS1.26]|uniref:alpha/beta hydrolase n=1 Tax=Rhizobium sp. 0TCS1.26 TaxID=3142623 RepID=UPI003D27B4CB